MTDPDRFKAVISIAPVTDLAALKEAHRFTADCVFVSNLVGSGNSVLEGSPVQQARAIKAPVLLFHGATDTNVSIEQSKAMDSRLSFYSKPHRLITWDKLDHGIEDREARALLLRESDEMPSSQGPRHVREDARPPPGPQRGTLELPQRRATWQSIGSRLRDETFRGKAMRVIAGTVAALAMIGVVHAQGAGFDAATAFGARPSVLGIRLSPDGKSVAYIGPTKGAGTAVVTLGLDKGASPHIAATADGNPLHITDCGWITGERLWCNTIGVDKDPNPMIRIQAFTKKLSFDADGRDTQQLGPPLKIRFGAVIGGDILDSLPTDGAVLMTRVYNPEIALAESRLAKVQQTGLGVDIVDVHTADSKTVEPPSDTATAYLADGHGVVRIMAVDLSKGQGGGFGFGPAPGAGSSGGNINYMYRVPGSRAWQKLGTYNILTQAGFRPVAIDAESNVAYGFKQKDGRLAVYSVKLDDSRAEELVYARDDVDVTGLVQIGRQQRVIGATYVAKTPGVHYFDAQLEHLSAALGKAAQADGPLLIVDSSDDQTKLLLQASSEADPGIYYIFDRGTKQLATFLPVRKPLEGAPLATVKPVSYTAGDGVSIAASLLLPPGKENAKGLPAIVVSDIGTAARDAQGFDWLAQFFVSRGYAVLEPGLRGVGGQGELWSQKAYSSWSVAVGDVVAGAKWLVTTGVADPKKLSIVGWASGGYAALQATASEPDLFKAVIAIDPVTDLSALATTHKMFPDSAQVGSFVGSGKDGSPIEHAAAIKASVLLFHAGMDFLHRIEDSKTLDAKLKSAGRHTQLVTWDNLDQQLDDSDARIDLLRKSEAFLHSAL